MSGRFGADGRWTVDNLPESIVELARECRWTLGRTGIAELLNEYDRLMSRRGIAESMNQSKIHMDPEPEPAWVLSVDPREEQRRIRK